MLLLLLKSIALSVNFERNLAKPSTYIG
jgi:hypothetical protein